MRRFFMNNKGMTLVEAIVAVLLIAIVVLSQVVAVTQSSVFSRRVDTIYTASYLAQRRIDMLKRLDFDLLDSAVETDIRIGADGNIDSNGNYIRTTEITEDYDGNPFLTKVKVSVQRVKVSMDGTYRDSVGKMDTVTQPVIMETLFANIE